VNITFRKLENFSTEAFNSMTVIEAFGKISIPFVNISYTAASGKIYNESQTVFNKTEIRDENPIESMTFFNDFPRKCFTFFSQLNDRFKDMKMKDESFKAIYFHLKEWFPLYETKGYSQVDTNSPKDLYHFSIHSPNVLPDFNSAELNFIILKLGRDYLVSYSRIITKLLPPNYSTNCRKVWKMHS